MKIDMRDKTMMMVVKMINAGLKPTQIQDMALKHAKASLSMDYIREVAKNKYPMFGDCWEEDAEESRRKLLTQKDKGQTQRNNALAERNQEAPNKAAERKRKQRQWMRNERIRRASLGLCHECGSPNDNGKARCDTCTNIFNQKQKYRWSNNRLRSCTIKI